MQDFLSLFVWPMHTKILFCENYWKMERKEMFLLVFCEKGRNFVSHTSKKSISIWLICSTFHPSFYSNWKSFYLSQERKKTFVPFLQYEKFVWTKPPCISTVFTLQGSILNCDNFVQMSARVRSVQHFRGVKYLQHTFRGNITLMTHMKVFEHMW